MGDVVLGLQVSAISMSIVFGVLALLMVVIGVMRRALAIGHGKTAAASPGACEQSVDPEIVSAIAAAVTCYLESEEIHDREDTKQTADEARSARRLKSIKTIRRIADDAWAVAGRQALMEQVLLRKVS
ncbi:MAG TPA: OadG family protein [Clostridia bacterium]|nr:OadG family protein [Clostridia bacterium]